MATVNDNSYMGMYTLQGGLLQHIGQPHPGKSVKTSASRDFSMQGKHGFKVDQMKLL
jgi:hypothetical protein